MTIVVGSTNPVKINAVTTAASESWPEVVVTGVEVASGIPEQPLGDEQTQQGAINRARAAFKTAHTLTSTPPAGQSDSSILGVGLEGGVLLDTDHIMWSTVWAAVVDVDDQVYLANGARFKVPSPVAQLILEGKEMGPIVAQLIGEADVRKKQGMIGVITEGFVDRTEEYVGIAKMALGLWYGRNWYDKYRSTSPI